MVTPLRTVHYEDRSMGYKFGNFKQAMPSNQDWYYLDIKHTTRYNPSTLQTFCYVIKEGLLFEDYNCHLKMGNSYEFKLNS